ncbi:MAG: toll/interleukin-1 receptor domain-containing protein [Xanthobacteraceae bacterium]
MAGSHLFICFSSKDEVVAREVVEALEAMDLKCWISLRDVLPGQNYQEAIVTALEAASGIVFLFSEHSNRSLEIKKELSIGDSIQVPVFPLRLSPIAPSGALRYELAVRQWIDIFPHRQHALARLAETIKNALHGSGADDSGPAADVRLAARQAAAAKMAAAGKRPSGKKPGLVPHAPIIASDSRQFEAIRTLLARHIGPIAKVLVEKAASEALNADEFCEKLATHVATPGDRNSFVRAVREQLATKP